MSNTMDKGKSRAVGSSVQDQDDRYRERYYELKKQAQEIERGNDVLHLEILKTRRNIQRVRMERAILLERLAGMPTLPPDPLPHTIHADETFSMDGDMYPTVSALQDLAREAVDLGVTGVMNVHQQPPMPNGVHFGTPVAEPRPMDMQQQPHINGMPYYPPPPPELPEMPRVPHQPQPQPYQPHQARPSQQSQQPIQQAMQQPLPLPQQQLVHSQEPARPAGRQVAFGPPAPASMRRGA